MTTLYGRFGVTGIFSLVQGRYFARRQLATGGTAFLYDHGQLYGDAPRKWMRSALAVPLMLIALSGTGCLGWGAHGGEGIVPSNIRNSSGEHLRITRTDSSKVALRRIVVSQDTLFGTTLGIFGRRVAIPLRDVTKVERQKFTKASAGVLAVAIIALAVLAWEVSQLEWGDAGFGGWSGS